VTKGREGLGGGAQRAGSRIAVNRLRRSRARRLLYWELAWKGWQGPFAPRPRQPGKRAVRDWRSSVRKKLRTYRFSVLWRGIVGDRAARAESSEITRTVANRCVADNTTRAGDIDAGGAVVAGRVAADRVAADQGIGFDAVIAVSAGRIASEGAVPANAEEAVGVGVHLFHEATNALEADPTTPHPTHGAIDHSDAVMTSTIHPDTCAGGAAGRHGGTARADRGANDTEAIQVNRDVVSGDRDGGGIRVGHCKVPG